MEELKKLIDSGIKKIEKLSLKIENELQIKEFISLVSSNKLEISEIKLEFSSLSLIDRSRLTVKFVEALDHIEGLKTFKLKAIVKDYALIALLQKESIRLLEKLGLEFGPEDYRHRVNINSPAFLEENMVSYLNDNVHLTSLKILDNFSQITAKKYPKFKLAICTHQKLTDFKQGFVAGVSKDVLANDPDLTAALAQKIESTPSRKKIRVQKDYETLTRELFWILGDLDEFIRVRQITHQKENHWLTMVHYLQSFLSKLEMLQHDLKNTEGLLDLEERQCRIDILLQYVTLVTRSAYLIGNQTKVKSLAPYKNELELLWDCMRVDLLEEIKQVKNNEFSKIVDSINSENKKLKSIYKMGMPRSYPASYNAIINENEDKLLQAKKLLEGYTKKDSCFFHGHSKRRHHTKEVDDIISRINSADKEAITTIDELLTELKKINLTNKNGSLSRRIQFIEDKFQNLDNLEQHLILHKI